MDILYYSNYCTHSQKVLQTLVKGNMSDKLSFICIDKRQLDKRTNQTYIILENGGKVVLPPHAAVSGLDSGRIRSINTKSRKRQTDCGKQELEEDVSRQAHHSGLVALALPPLLVEPRVDDLENRPELGLGRVHVAILANKSFHPGHRHNVTLEQEPKSGLKDVQPLGQRKTPTR